MLRAVNFVRNVSDVRFVQQNIHLITVVFRFIGNNVHNSGGGHVCEAIACMIPERRTNADICEKPLVMDDICITTYVL